MTTRDERLVEKGSELSEASAASPTSPSPPGTDRMLVTIPAGHTDPILTIQTVDGKQFAVPLPADAKPGTQVYVDVPTQAAPPTAAAVGVAVGPTTNNVVSSASPVVNNTVTNVTNVSNLSNVEINTVNISTVNLQRSTSMMDQVRPCFSWCCGYCALTVGVESTCSNTLLCCNSLVGCCRASGEGCVLFEVKNWISCSSCACIKCVGSFCCLAGASSCPCNKDIPMQVTCLWCTIMGPNGCGVCMSVDHAKALAGVSSSGAPESLEMHR